MVLKLGLLVTLGLLWSIRIAAIKAAGLAGVPVHVVVSVAALGIAGFFSIRALLSRDWPPLTINTGSFYVLSGVLRFLVPFALESSVAPHLPVFVFVVIIATMPLITFLLSVLLNREKLSPLSLVAIALGFVGAVVILWESSNRSLTTDVSVWWVLAGFSVPLIYAINTLFIAKHWPREARPVHVAHAQAIFIGGAAMIASAATGATSDWPLVLRDEAAILLIVFSEGSALLVYLRITRDYGATFVSLANYISIICAALIGALYFKDSLTTLTVASAMVIVASVGLYQWQSRAQTTGSKS